MSGRSSTGMPAKQQDTIVGKINQVRDMTAGVNLRPTPTTIRPEQSQFLQNTLISSVGELGVYPGYTSFMNSNGARRAQGGKRIYLKGGVVFTLLADNGNVYKPSDAGVQGSTVLTGLHATNAIDFPHDRTLVAAFDGSTVPQKSVDGTTWTQLGITAPTAGPTLTNTAGGSLVDTDTYEVTYTYQNSSLAEESNESAVSSQLVSAATGKTVHVVYVASTDAQVDKIKIYGRDKTAGESTRRLITTVANASSSFDITTNNWASGAASPTIGANSVALAMKFGVVWKNRWWGADVTTTNRLRFTQVFQHVWPDTFYVDIPFERGEGLTAMVALGDILIVFGITKFYLIIGQTSLDFEVRPALGAQTGAFGFRAVDVVEASVVHAGAPGVYIYNGATEQLLTYPIQPAWVAMMGAAASTAAEIAALPISHHKLQKELRVAVPFVQQTGNRGEWVLDLNRTNAPVAPTTIKNEQAWFSTDRTIGGYIQWDGNESTPGNQGRIFSWSPTVIQLFEERTGTNANGADMTMQYWGYSLPIGLQFGRIVDTYLEYKPAAQTSLSASLVVDGVTQGPVTLTMASVGASYGTAKYGTDTYGGGIQRAMLPIMWPLASEGHAAQMRLTYVGTDSPKFYTYGHNVYTEPFPRGF